jgi:MoxR-like ATPase
VMTSNGEREMPPAFLRRCIQVDIPEPTPQDLERIVDNHFQKLDEETKQAILPLIQKFNQRRELGDLATDQLLNAIYLAAQGVNILADRQDLESTVFHNLSQFRSG